MPQNRIRILREKKKLTQPQLAGLIEVNQKKLHGYEVHVFPTPFSVASRICKALAEPMEKVFPGTKKALSIAREKGKSLSALWADPEIIEIITKAGIDVDPSLCSFKFHLRGGVTGCLIVSGIERNRLSDVLQDSHRDSFVIFNADEMRVALNRNHLLSWQFLFDPGGVYPPKDDEHDPVSVYLVDRLEPILFSIDADPEKFGPEENDGWQTQSQGLLFELETVGGEPGLVVGFTDVDGERAYFNAADVSLVKIPLWAVEPEFDAFEGEDLMQEPVGTPVI